MTQLPIELSNHRLLLRPLRPDDDERLAAIASDADIWRFFVADCAERAALRAYVQDALAAARAGSRFTFAIVERESGALAGTTAFGNLSPRDQRIEIGWSWLGLAYHGSGINRHAKYLLMRYAFEHMNCERVEFKTDVLNQRARRALTNIGAVEEGVLRSHTLMPGGRRRDTIYYSVLRQEWPAVAGRLDATSDCARGWACAEPALVLEEAGA